MISISKRKGFDPSHHKFFNPSEPSGAARFCDIMLSDVWSPIVWRHGVRHRDNFISCAYLALDFDDGQWTLDSTEKWLADTGYAAIIGTSKSHQIEKKTPAGVVQPAVDRFRLVIPFASPIEDRDLYEYNIRQVMQDIPTDPSCKDAARYFFPCKKITFTRQGKRFPCITSKDDPGYLESLKIEKAMNERVKNKAAQGIVPGNILMQIHNGQDAGGRHKLCYRIGAQMKRAGFDTDTTINLICQGPLAEIGIDDVRRAVENGARAARERT